MASGDKEFFEATTTEHVSIEKSADILQATFQHYFNMAMDHNAKAATTTNILLVVVGAIIAIIGHDNEIKGIVDSGGAIAVCVIGLFGVVWVRKQQEDITTGKALRGNTRNKNNCVPRQDLFHGDLVSALLRALSNYQCQKLRREKNKKTAYHFASKESALHLVIAFLKCVCRNRSLAPHVGHCCSHKFIGFDSRPQGAETTNLFIQVKNAVIATAGTVFTEIQTLALQFRAMTLETELKLASLRINAQPRATVNF